MIIKSCYVISLDYILIFAFDKPSEVKVICAAATQFWPLIGHLAMLPITAILNCNETLILEDEDVIWLGEMVHWCKVQHFAQLEVLGKSGLHVPTFWLLIVISTYSSDVSKSVRYISTFTSYARPGVTAIVSLISGPGSGIELTKTLMIVSGKTREK